MEVTAKRQACAFMKTSCFKLCFALVPNFSLPFNISPVPLNERYKTNTSGITWLSIFSCITNELAGLDPCKLLFFAGSKQQFYQPSRDCNTVSLVIFGGMPGVCMASKPQCLRQDIFDDMPVYVGQAETTALIFVSQPLVINAH